MKGRSLKLMLSATAFLKHFTKKYSNNLEKIEKLPELKK